MFRWLLRLLRLLFWAKETLKRHQRYTKGTPKAHESQRGGLGHAIGEKGRVEDIPRRIY